MPTREEYLGIIHELSDKELIHRLRSSEKI